jgi:hypothetical protein
MVEPMPSSTIAWLNHGQLYCMVELFDGMHWVPIARVSGRFRRTLKMNFFPENELVALLLDLMAGGSIPLVEVLYEGLVLLARHKHVQVKVQSELDQFALGMRSPFATHPYDYGR